MSRKQKALGKLMHLDREKKNPLLVVIGRILFFALAFVVFWYVNTVLCFEGGTTNKGVYRAFYDQQENSVDVCVIGSSSVGRYYNPGVAYHDYGLSAFSFGATSMPIFFTDDIIEECKTTQNPKVYVIDLRNLRNSQGMVDEEDVRRTTDSLSLFNPRRYSMINEAVEKMSERREAGTFDDDLLDYYFPVVKYHSRLVNGEITIDDLLLKQPYNSTEGFSLTKATLTMSDQSGERITGYVDASSLSAEVKADVDEILAYTDGMKDQVVFTLSPFPYKSQSEANEMTTACKYIENRGYTVLNFNDDELLDQLDVDWSTDYYGRDHMNYLGSEKYTKFLSKWLKENYDLEDHRGDAKYEKWEKAYKKYEKRTRNGIKYVVNDEVDDEKQGDSGNAVDL